jgi:hypothetical protein
MPRGKPRIGVVAAADAGRDIDRDRRRLELGRRLAPADAKHGEHKNGPACP